MNEGKRPLVIGIGNVLRSDDGAGYRVAEELHKAIGDQLDVLAVHQLTPELACRVASASRVLFVDASLDPLRSGLKPLEGVQQAPQTSSGVVGLGHRLTPQMLLALAQGLYHHRPPAWELLIPAQHLDHGAALSGLTSEACTQALSLALAWGRSHA